MNLWTYRADTMVTRGNDLIGYGVEAVDGSIGKIDQTTDETDNAHVVVDTGPWIFGKKRIIPAGAITAVDRENQKVAVQMTKQQIKDAPDLDDTINVDTSNRGAYDDYYSPFGW